MKARLLSIDTCAASGSAALVTADFATMTVTCLEQCTLGRQAASAELVPALARMLHGGAAGTGEAGRLSLSGLHALVVVNGPGSFTGIRVALSTAKGLAHGAGLPVVAVSRLQVLEEAAGGEGEAWMLLDAGRGEFYVRQGGREWLASREEVAAAADAGAALVLADGDGLDRLDAPAQWRLRRAGPLDAVAAARTALRRIRAAEYDDVAGLDANYLRRSDAELFARRPTP